MFESLHSDQVKAFPESCFSIKYLGDLASDDSVVSVAIERRFKLNPYSSGLKSGRKVCDMGYFLHPAGFKELCRIVKIGIKA
ncbi:hypothetical protein V6582_06110 [Agrobacterium vitis]|uniref:hypothetical protein n=1 Tax=Agrobacterium vitis TaxID=373 RepID=UPI0013245BE0|nr:hypothetical protein [Agrobacterium vitis]MVA24593.1 hypothetical protein [Agrobacterium vitis]